MGVNGQERRSIEAPENGGFLSNIVGGGGYFDFSRVVLRPVDIVVDPIVHKACNGCKGICSGKNPTWMIKKI